MKNERITPLEKNKISLHVTQTVQATSPCCGGAPIQDETACCKLDEKKKAEDEICGGNTREGSQVTSSCC